MRRKRMWESVELEEENGAFQGIGGLPQKKKSPRYRSKKNNSQLGEQWILIGSTKLEWNVQFST